MYKFAHRIIASIATAGDINAVASSLGREVGVQFEVLQPGKTKCLVADTALSKWGTKRLDHHLGKMGFQKKSETKWVRSDLEVRINDDHLVIQERGAT